MHIIVDFNVRELLIMK